ncbi:Lead, cadmium, zinc and mercury transporting ATPase [Pediococcus damnosus]|uniref:Lead, cadmium, zinc and mercury transporting ATPase n=1 Tax=Pediococcus damnosus TaxID=51663 RepID=A0AAC9B0F1_9LACO|nr:HAD-IC family P-type ATPase [Pediococcus damnosus]AMV59761.1 Lead, cadmium, zinc and mercury transporting ATPase [Pediococcus damnosus]AMV61990.1 Lead, cadmium, zinc and mercury transporting ATPase [Pediococcus damnosus]AMV64007.1 Lead, cadmium, zinc and mercury transporting ATPase [Pediococcus damnosus]AMV66129.1 Lead, cadmium, zinc and mercury transporting ATPase [Pediococcus damnosus]KRN52065.1 P-type ATPase [Pediococcus damnosus]
MVDTKSDQNSNFEEQFMGNSGLSSKQVEQLTKQYGNNEVPTKEDGPFIGTLKRMWNPISWLLEAAIIFEFILGKQFQALVIVLLLLFSAIDGEIQERRAKNAVGFLHKKLKISVRVLRDNKWQVCTSKELVPGDIIHQRVGDIVSADLQILQGTVSVNQAALTGESADVTIKSGGKVVSGSTITHGEIIAKVIATGSQSSYGKTVGLSQNSEAPGRLQTLLFNIVRYLAYLDIVLAIILVITAFIRGTSWQELLPFLVILFIATIPISMPSSFTVANSLEAKELTKQQVLVTGLTGIQEAASLDVLLIDKTGTLTKNQSKVSNIIRYNEEYDETNLIKLAAAAADDTANDAINNAILSEFNQRHLEGFVRKSFKGFDPAVKFSTAEIVENGSPKEVVMGSPITLQKMGNVPETYINDIKKISSSGARVLAIGIRANNNQQFTIVGLIGLTDMPKEDAKEAVQKIRDRGIKVIMLTGDTRETAKVIAEKVGIGDRISDIHDALNNPLAYDGYANVFPEDKFKVVKALQDQGSVVGMTGDGINDAPALKQADVGIAVSTATDAAKKAAKVVLTNDSLLDIMKVIDSGHRVYRRMMTWTITKLARTAELAALLTFGFIFAGFFPVSLSLIVFIVVMNDMVTLVLGTDRAVPSRKPEHWDLLKLTKIAAIFTIGWLAVGLMLLWYFVSQTVVSQADISSLMFLYLIYSAMTTILMTRTEGVFWRSRPSNWVAGMVALDIVVATCLAAEGWITTPVSWAWILLVMGITVIATIILDFLKVQYYRHEKK